MRVAVVKLGVNNGSDDLVRENEVFIKYEAEVSSRMSDVE